MSMCAYVYTNTSPNRPAATIGVRAGVAYVVDGSFGTENQLEPLYDAKTQRQVDRYNGEQYLQVLFDTYQNTYMWIEMGQCL